MVKVSIICLIYRSVKLADWVWESAQKYTPMLHTGEAEFLFVANDPTDALLRHLQQRGYHFIVNRNVPMSDADLFAKGYAKPEYISRVYKGYNQGILAARGERIVLVNSDNYFSEDWLENLLKYATFNNIVCSQIVEPGHEKHHFFPTALRADFGRTPDTFRPDDFAAYVLQHKKTGLKDGGAYMPCLFWRELAYYVGLYPEGNLAGTDFNTVIRYGDEAFYDKLAHLGVRHVTALDSIVYHLKEGEKDDITIADEGPSMEPNFSEQPAYSPLPTVALKEPAVLLTPDAHYPFSGTMVSMCKTKKSPDVRYRLALMGTRLIPIAKYRRRLRKHLKSKI